MTTALALPDPHVVTVAQVRASVVPMAQAARASIRESGSVAAASDLARRLEAFRGYLRDREAQAVVAAETRRTEVLIGHLLGPPVVGVNQHTEGSHTSEASPLSKDDRTRFRNLAEHETRVEALLASGVVARRAILDALQRAERGTSEPPAGRFSTIVADPPWQYGNSGTRANAAGHYVGSRTLSVPQLCGLEPMPDGTKLTEQVEAWRADDAHLYLWTTAGFLRDAFDVMEAWGFTYKTFLAWVKPQMGMGNYFRVSSELVLFGVRGRLPIEHRGLMNWWQAKRGKHSAKPQQFYKLVTKASPGPFLEMFSRCYAADALPGTCHCSKCARGWEVWGNEA